MKRNSEWISISDMMSGLMLVFMFIAISYMTQLQSETEEIARNLVLENNLTYVKQMAKKKEEEFTKKLLEKEEEIKKIEKIKEDLNLAIVKKEEELKNEIKKKKDLNLAIVKKENKLKSEIKKRKDLNLVIVKKEKELKSEIKKRKDLNLVIVKKEKELESEIKKREKIKEDLNLAVVKKEEDLKNEIKKRKDLNLVIVKKEKELENEIKKREKIKEDFNLTITKKEKELEELKPKVEIYNKHKEELKAMKSIAISYNKNKGNLNKNLLKEFSKDLKSWKAQISDDNTIVFNSPDVLFKKGQSKIKPRFKEILRNFFPRYISILSLYKDEIEEIRVEGHTSKDWYKAKRDEEIYLKNMELSQRRANEVLSFCYLIKSSNRKEKEWLEKKLRANGMAFSKLKYKDKKKTIEDGKKSRRVEFKVQMKTEEKIYKILEASN